MGWIEPYLPSLESVSIGAEADAVGHDLPDHELVVARVGDMVDVRSSEEIVRNISVDVARAGAPSNVGRDAVDAADQLLVEGELLSTR